MARAPAPVAGHELDAEVLHRRVEVLLDDRLQAVDLVDEQDVAAAERGEDARQVALALERRARGHAHLGPQLVREQVRQRGLAEPGRPGEQHVVERLAALARRLRRRPRGSRRPCAGRRTRRSCAGAAPRRRRARAAGRGALGRDHAPGRAARPRLRPSSCFLRAIAYLLRSAASASLHQIGDGPRRRPSSSSSASNSRGLKPSATSAP